MNTIECTAKDGKHVCSFVADEGKTNSLPAEVYVGTNSVTVSIDVDDGSMTDKVVPWMTLSCRRNTDAAPRPDEYSCLVLEYEEDGPRAGWGRARGCNKPTVGHRSVNQKGQTMMHLPDITHPTTFVIDQPE